MTVTNFLLGSTTSCILKISHPNVPVINTSLLGLQYFFSCNQIPSSCITRKLLCCLAALLFLDCQQFVWHTTQATYSLQSFLIQLSRFWRNCFKECSAVQRLSWLEPFNNLLCIGHHKDLSLPRPIGDNSMPFMYDADGRTDRRLRLIKVGEHQNDPRFQSDIVRLGQFNDR